MIYLWHRGLYVCSTIFFVFAIQSNWLVGVRLIIFRHLLGVAFNVLNDGLPLWFPVQFHPTIEPFDWLLPDLIVQSRHQSCMGLYSNTALVLAKDLFEKTNKLANVILDGGPFMLERACAAITNDLMWHHIVFLLMIKFVNFFSEYLTPFCSVPHTRSMLVFNQLSTNKTSSNCVNAEPLGFTTFFF